MNETRVLIVEDEEYLRDIYYEILSEEGFYVETAQEGNEGLAKVKQGAIIVNLAPNELVNLDALGKRLAKGDITYVMDHSDELSPEQLKMLSVHKNCVIYPPIGYTTAEATANKQEIFVSNIENFLAGKPSNKVN